jgi:hypothetical protein
MRAARTLLFLRIFSAFVFFIAKGVQPQQSTGLRGEYFGQKKPGLEPAVFGPAVNKWDVDISAGFAGDGTLYFTSHRPDAAGVYCSRLGGGEYGEMEKLPRGGLFACVAAVPQSVKTLVSRGHTVIVQKDAGVKAFYPSEFYEEAGARIAADAASVYGEADVVFKIRPPSDDKSTGKHELDLMKKEAAIMCFLAPP